jgi:hypothetical protein
MPREAPVSARVERDLFDAARRGAGLPENATQGQVVRYALAVVAGRDPSAETYRLPGYAGRWAREARAS